MAATSKSFTTHEVNLILLEIPCVDLDWSPPSRSPINQTQSSAVFSPWLRPRGAGLIRQFPPLFWTSARSIQSCHPAQAIRISTDNRTITLRIKWVNYCFDLLHDAVDALYSSVLDSCRTRAGRHCTDLLYELNFIQLLLWYVCQVKT